jgi:LmbE family N-acetylglucosaminyl deacetylase
VLVLAPHPDDESLGCGGSLILHARHHDPVKVVFMTDGAAGDVGNRYPRDEYVALRQREARQAGEVLGISDLEFWNLPDGELSPYGAPLDRLVRLLEDYQPSLVYAPSPLEFHPDHRATAALLWQAMQRVPPSGQVAFFEYNRPLHHVDTLVDITPVVEQKKTACDVYRSQLANYPYTACAIALNRYRALTVSAVSEYAEGYVLMDARALVGRPLETFTLRQFLPASRPAEGPAPLVSIIVRTKNRPARLREALASLLVQTQPDLEVIVVNDGGEDVGDVVAEFARYLDIRCTSHEVSSGRAAAANVGLKSARGKYVNFLDDDDLLHPQHVEKLATFLEATGGQVAYSDCQIAHYRPVGTELIPIKPKSRYMGFDFDRERLYFGNYIPIMTAMFRRRLLAEVEPFDESLEYFEDWDFWLRLAQLTTFHHLPGVTAEYRVFAAHEFDRNRWRLAVYQKHRRHLTTENLVKFATVADGVEDRATELLDVLAQEREGRAREAQALLMERDALRAELRLLQDSAPQRLSRLLRRYLPDRLVRLLRAWIVRAEGPTGQRRE